MGDFKKSIDGKTYICSIIHNSFEIENGEVLLSAILITETLCLNDNRSFHPSIKATKAREIKEFIDRETRKVVQKCDMRIDENSVMTLCLNY